MKVYVVIFKKDDRFFAFYQGDGLVPVQTNLDSARDLKHMLASKNLLSLTLYPKIINIKTEKLEKLAIGIANCNMIGKFVEFKKEIEKYYAEGVR